MKESKIRQLHACIPVDFIPGLFNKEVLWQHVQKGISSIKIYIFINSLPQVKTYFIIDVIIVYNTDVVYVRYCIYKRANRHPASCHRIEVGTAVLRCPHAAKGVS